ncbi:hypothetical protein FRZ61_12630 [Hypericibacter adhaerens]|uniref:Uncharacterized protein n=1 Tax=Hypericibacter adhaerens TaxID=2602016 RepID=A0A5J6MUJ9_9PROT|nr:hypothetical protein FRZ61_12630 [Hypericibacter adhaerens]
MSRIRVSVLAWACRACQAGEREEGAILGLLRQTGKPARPRGDGLLAPAGIGGRQAGAAKE